jgi:hypothetical protein
LEKNARISSANQSVILERNSAAENARAQPGVRKQTAQNVDTSARLEKNARISSANRSALLERNCAAENARARPGVRTKTVQNAEISAPWGGNATRTRSAPSETPVI